MYSKNCKDSKFLTESDIFFLLKLPRIQVQNKPLDWILTYIYNVFLNRTWYTTYYLVHWIVVVYLMQTVHSVYLFMVFTIYVSHHECGFDVLCNIKINLPRQVRYLLYNISARLKHVYFVEYLGLLTYLNFKAIHTIV